MQINKIPEYIKIGAKKELARRNLYDYCQLMNPKFYKDDRIYLKNMCNKIQEFIKQDEKKFLVINLPPLLDMENHLQAKTQLNGYLEVIQV